MHEDATDIDPRELAKPGRLESVPAWYYDPATNSLQNGGVNPQGVLPTSIPKESLRELLAIGLGEELAFVA
jgi:hypothetical protein